MTRDVGGAAISTRLLPRKSQRKPRSLPRIEFYDLSRRMIKQTKLPVLRAKTQISIPRKRRLILVFARAHVILLVLSCCGS